MRLSSNKGSILVLTIIIIAVITALGASVLNITMNHLQIKKSNSELKKCFYLSEDGLNNAYLRVYDLIYEASEDSLDVAEEYLKLHPDDVSGASNVFVNNYKLHIINNVISRIRDNSNPNTEVINTGVLTFIQNKLKVRVTSRYISNTKVEKFTSADIIILVPKYSDIVEGKTDNKALIYMDNFDL